MIVKNDKRVKVALKKAFGDKSNKDIVADARKNNINIGESNLSRYLKHGNVPGSISEAAIIWLCKRYGVKLKLIVD